jgi:hypothetical protein
MVIKLLVCSVIKKTIWSHILSMYLNSAYLAVERRILGPEPVSLHGRTRDNPSRVPIKSEQCTIGKLRWRRCWVTCWLASMVLTYISSLPACSRGTFARGSGVEPEYGELLRSRELARVQLLTEAAQQVPKCLDPAACISFLRRSMSPSGSWPQSVNNLPRACSRWHAALWSDLQGCT